MRLLVAAILVAFAAVGVNAQTPPAEHAPTSGPASALLQQLDGEVRQAYCRTIEGVVRVYLPAKAINPASDVLRKWERRLNPDVRQRLGESQLAPPTTSPTTNVAVNAPVAATQPTTTPASMAEAVTIGIVLNDAGELLVPIYLDKSKLPEPLRVVTKDGQTATATIVGADRSTALSLVRCDRPLGRPLRLADKRPVEGALLIALCGDETRLLVWTGVARDSAIAVLPDGAVAILRNGRFVGGSGYATLLDQLRTNGEAKRGLLGMMVNELSPAQHGRLAKLNVVDRPGVEVTAVLPNLPAERAGVRPGDLLLEVDGHAVPDLTSLAALLTEVKGATTLTIGRADQRIELAVDAQVRDPAQ